MSRHPADRDLRTYGITSLLCALVLIACTFGVGIVLKQERKAMYPKPIGHGSCYIMSDDIVVCR